MSSSSPVRIVAPGDHPPLIATSEHIGRLDAYGKVVVHDDLPETDEDKVARCAAADVIINSWGITKWPGSVIRRLPRLRLIATCSIGTDMVDLDAARECGIVVCNQPGDTAPVVAEHMFGLMFAVAKRAAFYTSELRAGRWTKIDNVMLQGKTLGVIGTGATGSEMARLARAIGMRVVAWTFNPSPARAERLGVEYVELDELLRVSDVVSAHVKLTDDSRHMLGEREFGLMKPGALFLNGARGAVADTSALVAALNSGHLGGAGVDVYETEPLPADDPLLACEQIVLTTHCADLTPEGAAYLGKGAVENVIAFLEGRPRNIVT
jgi:phosphoglycerate dehydrogenase-like enzyme